MTGELGGQRYVVSADLTFSAPSYYGEARRHTSLILDDGAKQAIINHLKARIVNIATLLSSYEYEHESK